MSDTNNKLLVLEMNEVPLEILQVYAEHNPKSYLAGCLAEERFCLSNAEDLPEYLLYPSQTWASLNTGRPFSEHKIKWFNDPKDFQDFYWAQAAREGRSTVLVSTLHSSPLKQYVDQGNYQLVIPDFFAEDHETLPECYQNLQALNLALSFNNRRNSRRFDSFKTALWHFLHKPNLAAWGVGKQSIRDLLPLAGAVLKNPEVLRQVQFPLLAQIFINELHKKPPDLGIIFTNHIASAMHRYWPALMSDTHQVYQSDWYDSHRKEILAALGLLDRWLILLDNFAKQHDYALAIVSSMGQRLNSGLDKDFIQAYTHDYRLEEPEKLLHILNLPIKDSSLQQLGAMLPQYSFKVEDPQLFNFWKQQLDRLQSDARVQRYGHYSQPNEQGELPLQGMLFAADYQFPVITLTLMLDPDDKGNISIGGQTHHYGELGFSQFAIQDHHAGEHSKQGVLLFNERFAECAAPPLAKTMNYLDVADVFRQVLGIQCAAQ